MKKGIPIRVFIKDNIDEGFPSTNYQIHSLSLFNQYFFPDAPKSTVIGIEGTNTTTIIRNN